MKKKLAAFMAIIAIIQALPCTVFAETEVPAETATAAAESESKDTNASEEDKMKAALTLVKSRITIPDEFSNFSYSSPEE